MFLTNQNVSASYDSYTYDGDDGMDGSEFEVNATANGTVVDMFPTPRYVGRFLQTATMTLVFVAALLGNSLVILLCLKKPKELKVSRRLILHLAILNLNMAILVLPSVIVSAAAQAWVLSHPWCVATGFFKNLFCVCIIFNLLLISLDRYLSVVKPLHYHSSATVKYHGAFLAGIWLLSTLVALPPLIGWNKIMYHPSRYTCTGDWSETDPSYSLFIFLGFFVIPLFLMMFVYWTIYKAARRLMKRKQGRRLSADVTDSGCGSGGGGSGGGDSHSHSQHEVSSGHSSDGRRSGSTRGSGIARGRSSRRLSLRINVSDEWKIAKTGVIVMASFIICWLPYYIVLMVDAAYGFGTTVPLSMPYAWWECFAMWMALSSCAVNPYVYVLRSPMMRAQASKAAHNMFARFRECCCEEDSRKIRRRQNSGKTGRYSFMRISNRFSSRKRPARKPQTTRSTPKEHEGEEDKVPEEAERMMPQQTDLAPGELTGQRAGEEEDTEPEPQIELLSHKKIDV